MKLEFQSKSSSKPKPSKKFQLDQSNQPESSNNQEFVSEFDPEKTLISSTKKKIIIPPKANEWRPHKKMKNLELPPLQAANKPLDFEMEVENPNPDTDVSMSYGLNLRAGSGEIGSSSGGFSSIEALMINQFRNDLKELPEEQGVEEYDDTPVDGFGAALLAGYGWKEGRGIGKNARGDVEVVEYKRRTAKEGLGFMADHPPNPNPDPPKIEPKNDKGTENRGNRDEKNDLFGVGKEVRVVKGDKMGLKGTIVEVLSGGLVVLGSERGKRETFRVEDIAGLGSVEEERCLSKLKELKIRDRKTGNGHDGDDGKSGKSGNSVKRESKRSRERVSERVESEGPKREEKSSNGSGSGSGKAVMWLMSHIRVRIISKDLKKGKYFLKKGEVVDVIGPGICDISMDEGRETVRGVNQDILETALPKRGGFVVVLLGKHKGVYGKLVEKDSEKETGVIQDADTLEMFNVRLEQIAEYLGDPSYLGY